VVKCDPLALRVHRIDLTADVIGSVPVDAYRTSMRVRRTRNSTDYSNPNYESPRHESGRYETIYFGSPKSKKHLRVYDKRAERRQRRLKEFGQKNLKKEPEMLLCFPERWVRIERTLRSDGIPPELRTLGDLLRNGAEYDPFADIEISPNCADIPLDWLFFDCPNLKPQQRKNAAWTLATITKFGRTKAASNLRANNGDPESLFQLLDAAVADKVSPMPTPADLTARYRESFITQMFGRSGGKLPQWLRTQLYKHPLQGGISP
jgi:hypothetical protein